MKIFSLFFILSFVGFEKEYILFANGLQIGYTHGMRKSVYKDKITTLLGKKHLLSVAEIQKEIGADFSTIFRNLESLVTAGLVKKVLIGKDVVLYEMAGKDDHDHFVCGDCGKVEAIRLNHRNLRVSGLVNDVLIRGRCGECF